MAATNLPAVAFAVEQDDPKGKTEATAETADPLEKAKKAETTAKEERDKAFEAKKKETAKAYEDSKTANEKAKDEYDAAAAALKTRTEENNKALEAKKKIEGELSKLNEQKNAAHQQVASIPAEIKKAEQARTDAETKWKKDKEAADKAVNEAQAASDAAGKEFINKKINDPAAVITTAEQNNQPTTAAQGGKDLDAMIAACKTYTTANVEPVTDKNGTRYTTIAEIANSKNFESVVKRACRYENLKKSVKYIKEANTHRKLPAHNTGDLKVSYQLMGTAIISAAIDVYQTGHNLIKGDKGWSFWKSGNSGSAAENLAYSPVSSEAGWDPFHGWYYEERIVVLAQNRKTDIKQSIIDEVLNESRANGFAYDPYKAPWNQTKDSFLKGMDRQTDHYKTLLDGKYKATGFAYIDGADYKVGKFPYVAAQEFNTDTTLSVSVEDYEKEFEEWFKPYLKPLETARANRKALDKEPEALTQARKTIQEKKQELEKAKKSFETATKAINAKKKELEKAKGISAQKQKELKAALTNWNNKKAANEKAQKTMTTKAELSKKAQGLDVEKPETYKDFADLKELAETYAKAKKAREEAEKKATGSE